MRHQEVDPEREFVVDGEKSWGEGSCRDGPC